MQIIEEHYSQTEKQKKKMLEAIIQEPLSVYTMMMLTDWSYVNIQKYRAEKIRLIEY
jgi:hypothetical protein